MPKMSKEKPAPREDKLFVASIEKAFRVLECFQSSHRRVTLTQLGELTKLDNSSLQRLLHTLLTLGYIRKDANRQYSLTPRVLNLGTNYLRTNDLVERATPCLQAAHAASGETINLIELDDTDTVFVIRFLAAHPTGLSVLLGSRTPVFCSGAGRAILAHLPEAEAISIIERTDKKKFTKKTLTATDAIMAQVRKVRDLGYAVSDEEFMVGDVSVGAPVFDHTGSVTAAVSVPVSSARWQSHKVREQIVSLVTSTARSVSNSYGGSKQAWLNPND